MWPNMQFLTDLGIFIEEILNGKPHFWSGVLRAFFRSNSSQIKTNFKFCIFWKVCIICVSIWLLFIVDLWFNYKTGFYTMTAIFSVFIIGVVLALCYVYKINGKSFPVSVVWSFIGPFGKTSFTWLCTCIQLFIIVA